MKNKDYYAITVRVTPEQYKALKDIAEKHGKMSLAAVLRFTANQYIEEFKIALKSK